MIRLIIPAFNEARALVSLLPRLPTILAGHRVVPLVVSDGSTDDTVAVARRAGVEVIPLMPNRGKGSAIRAALARLESDVWDIAVLMDADGQHDPSDLEVLVAPLAGGGVEIAVGSRYLNDEKRGSTPFNRYAVRWTTVAILHRILRTRYTDPYCGFRAFTRDALDRVEFCGDRYEGELEVLFDARRCGIDVVEVPIQKIYGSGMSKVSANGGQLLGRLRVIRQYLFTIVRKTREIRSARSKTGVSVD
jgi:glycosyltransferase involved in cell wall biosynthesis